MARIKKILVPIDFSDTSRLATDMACELALPLEASITLLHVYQIPAYVLPEGVVVAGPETVTDLMSRINDVLAARRQQVEDAGVKGVHAETATGTPFVEIVRAARDGGYDLIVMGTHGRGGLTHALMGSVAERVVRKAPCPVLTIKPPDHKYEPP